MPGAAQACRINHDLGRGSKPFSERFCGEVQKCGSGLPSQEACQKPDKITENETNGDDKQQDIFKFMNPGKRWNM